jgi:hypothetical protein
LVALTKTMKRIIAISFCCGALAPGKRWPALSPRRTATGEIDTSKQFFSAI